MFAAVFIWLSVFGVLVLALRTGARGWPTSDAGFSGTSTLGGKAHRQIATLEVLAMKFPLYGTRGIRCGEQDKGYVF